MDKINSKERSVDMAVCSFVDTVSESDNFEKDKVIICIVHLEVEEEHDIKV